MTLTPRVKESIKTALAMTITLGIALSMDWDRPYWAGFAVALISLSTIGQSLNKGAMRMLGTLLALVVSLLIIALFVQDRWLFMVALSAWVGFCTYRMGMSRHWYFWFLAGFASVIISFDGGTDPINAFDTAILRAQETFLGVLVYTLISTLLWPTNSRAGFEGATRALVHTQHQLYLSCRETIAGHTPGQDESAQDVQAVSAQQVQVLTQFGAMLEAALTDSYEVWELRHQWHRFQGQSTVLHETLERWHETRKELGELDLNGLLPGLGAAATEIERRFAEIERLLAGEALQHQPQKIDLSSDQDRLHNLSHFHKAAFSLFRTGLQRLDELTREQLELIIEIKDPDVSHIELSRLSKESDQQSFFMLLDTDSIIAALRAMAGLWLAFLLWIYVRVPAGSGIVSLAAPFGMMLAFMPRIPVFSTFKPALTTIAVSGLLYVFVMPHLSSFVGLGAMIFLYVFAVAYLFSKPQQGMIRSTALAFFLITIGLSNSSQQYDILSVIDSTLMFITVLFCVLIPASYFPFSSRPDKVFLRLLGRFFRSSEYLMTTMRWDPTMTPTRLDYWRRAFHARELATLPQKLGAWGKVVNTRVLSNTTPEHLQTITTNLQALAYRMQELMDARANPQSELLVRELLTDMRVWRLKVQEALQVFSRDPAALAVNELREQLTTSIEHLEVRIEEILNKAGESDFSNRDGENFYHLLGAYRGLSEAMIEYAGTAEGIDWDQWRESRF